METKTSVLLNAAPPYGHIMANEKWRDSSIIQNMKGGGVKTLFDAELGVIDFYLPNKSCVLYISECDVIVGNDHKRKLVRFRNANGSGFQKMVMVERTRLSEQYFSSLQKFVVLELGLSVLPVASQTEASQLITQMVNSEGRENPFRRRKGVSGLCEPLLLSLLQQVPSVGSIKAVALLQSFPSLQELCGAGVQQLEPLVGHTAAQHIHHFFHKPLL